MGSRNSIKICFYNVENNSILFTVKYEFIK